MLFEAGNKRRKVDQGRDDASLMKESVKDDKEKVEEQHRQQSQMRCLSGFLFDESETKRSTDHERHCEGNQESRFLMRCCREQTESRDTTSGHRHKQDL